ncbi:MAG: fibronectin type III domain-containing protein, partial [Deferrisomatales bacterium]
MKRRLVFPLVLALVLFAAAALAAGPAWMPGFPMRMGPNVMLMWSPIPGAASYNLYRSFEAGKLGEKAASVPMNNHMDPNVPSDKDVFYTVKAVMPGGVESDASQVATLTGLKPLDPPKWIGELYQNKQLSIRWEAQSGAAFYNLFKAEAKAGPFALLGSVQEPKYVDTAVEEGKTYWYQVTAVDKNNVESPKAETREVLIPKAAVVVVAKTWDFVEKVMPFGGHWRGEAVEIKGPGDLAI